MNKLHLATAALTTAIGMTGAAYAADLPPAPVYPVPVMECAWCGVYGGLNAGGDWGRSQVTLKPGGFWNEIGGDPNAPFFGQAGSPSFNRSNFSGGGQIGVNSQWGGLVAGLEVDMEYIGFSASRTASFTGPAPAPFGGTPEIFNFHENVENSWVSTQRIRLGWAESPTLLLYGTGGLALSNQKFSQTYNIPNFNGGGVAGLAPGFTANASGGGAVSTLVAGWTAGGGVEWKFAHNWSLRAEYLYVDLGEVQFDSTLTGTSGGVAIGGLYTSHHTEHLWTNIARLGINYQFWSPVGPPILAK